MCMSVCARCYAVSQPVGVCFWLGLGHRLGWTSAWACGKLPAVISRALVSAGAYLRSRAGLVWENRGAGWVQLFPWICDSRSLPRNTEERHFMSWRFHVRFPSLAHAGDCRALRNEWKG